ncbi:hypothetical protein [Nocardioides sp. URHA0032]|uniref:hypothetical protein n=1 Tax=Nocardioides sp. URHA0032 TaxID=1380388 RepID=UPI000490EB7A|nr:hypothetical protein [Nocardioides sp. URHA0032]
MRRAATIWGSALGGLLTYDLLCDRRKDNSTLCSVIRWLVELIPGGKYVFRALLILGAYWFDGHILKPLAERHICRVVRDAT